MMSQREEFENKFRGRFDMRRDPNTQSRYFAHATNWIWEAWLAAIAASQQAAQPKTVLMPASMLAQWEITKDMGSFSSMALVSDSAIIAYAQDILAAAGANAALIEALHTMRKHWLGTYFNVTSHADALKINGALSAALASLPPTAEAQK